MLSNQGQNCLIISTCLSLETKQTSLHTIPLCLMGVNTPVYPARCTQDQMGAIKHTRQLPFGCREGHFDPNLQVPSSRLLLPHKGSMPFIFLIGGFMPHKVWSPQHLCVIVWDIYAFINSRVTDHYRRARGILCEDCTQWQFEHDGIQ